MLKTLPTLRMIGRGALLAALCAPAAMALSLDLLPENVAPAADYNIRVGNLKLGLEGVLTTSYDDNITSAADNDAIKEGWSVTPALKLALDWPVSPYIHLGSGLAFGYRYYPNGEGEDNLFVAGAGGDLSAGMKVDFFVGNGVLRVSEKFAREVDTLESAVRDLPDDYVLTRNTIGARYQVDFSEYMRLIADYKHENAWTNKDDFEYQDHVRDGLNLVCLWAVNRQLRVGPYLRAESVNYTESLHNDATSYEGGVGFTYQRPAGFVMDGSLGWEKLNFDLTNVPAATDEASEPTARLSVRMASSQFTSHTVSASYGPSHGTLSGPINFAMQAQLMYGITANIAETITLKGDVVYVDIKESDGGESSELVRVGLGGEYRLSERSKLDLRLERTDKSSDDDSREFDRNVLTLTYNYNF